MSIRDIERAKKLRLNCKDLNREDLSKRAEDIIEKMSKDHLYQGLWEAIGRLHIIALLMKTDGYMAEKISIGEQKEECCINAIAKGIIPKYIGYNDKDIV